MKRRGFFVMVVALMAITCAHSQDFNKISTLADKLEKSLRLLSAPTGKNENLAVAVEDSSGMFSAISAVVPSSVEEQNAAGGVMGSVEEAGDATQSPSTFLGDFGNSRSWLSEHGVEMEFVYKADHWSNINGGIQRSSEFLDNIDYKFSIDAEKMIGLAGTSLFVSFLTNHGNNPSDHTGDAQGVSNIAAFSTTKVYQAWIESKFFDAKLAVLAGLYDLNSEFYVTNTSGLFIHPSLGIGTDFSQTGKNGPSIFPTMSLGMRVKYAATDEVSIQAVVLDGVPGDPENPKGTHIQLRKEDGALVVAEAVYTTGAEEGSHDRYSKYAIGGWMYTGAFDDLLQVDEVGEAVKRNDNRGLYVLAETDVFREESRGLAVFGRFGVANGAINQFSSCLTGGVVYTGLISGRESDQCGIAFGLATNGSQFMEAMNIAGTPMKNSELAIEFSYHATLTSWLAVQPDVEYIKNPGTDPAIDDAVLFGMRLEVSF